MAEFIASGRGDWLKKNQVLWIMIFLKSKVNFKS